MTFGAIFDWDGVIIDSSRQHEKGWELLAAEEKRLLPENFFRRSFGMKNENIIPQLLQWTTDAAEIRRLSDRKEELYRETIARDQISLLAGAKELLAALEAESVPCAIASSTPRPNIDCVIDRLGIRAFFRAIVTGEDVHHGKPNPEVFLLAASRLGVAPVRCVVFEDAHVGVEAGLAGRMKVIAVATTHPASSLGDAHLVVSTLKDVDLETITALF
jgi:beta-phosphoglucomutase family hydrolase